MQSAGRKAKFSWTVQQADADHHEHKLSAVPHDTVPKPAEPASQIDLEAMCVCRDDVEDFADYTFCYVHLDRALLQELEQAVPFEECFGVDVTERHVRAYFLADEDVTVFEADLSDRCIPDYTFWQLVRARKGDPKGRGEAFNPALQIGIVKHPDAHGQAARFVERCRHLDEIVNEKRHAEEAEYKKCEDRLRARCLEFCGRDGRAQTAHQAPDPGPRAPGGPGALAAPRPEQPGKQLPEEADYLVDNSMLRAKTKGLGYRRSPILIDKDGEELAAWGIIVRGVDLGSGWLKVGDRYLPMKLNGEQVLTGDVIGLPSTRPEKREYV